jgi:hypothetical protein
MTRTLLILFLLATAGGRAESSHLELGLRPVAWPLVEGKPAVTRPPRRATTLSDTLADPRVRAIAWASGAGKPLVLHWPREAAVLADTLAALGFVPSSVTCEGAVVSGEFASPSNWRAPDFAAFEKYLLGLPIVERATVDLPGNPSPSTWECPGTTPPEILYRVWPRDSTLCSRQVTVLMTIDATGQLTTFSLSPGGSDECRKALARVLKRWRFRPARELFRPVEREIAVRVGDK